MKRAITIAGLLLLMLAAACGGGMSEAEQHNERGMELAGEWRWEESIAEFDRAIELEPSLALAYTNRGDAYVRLKCPLLTECDQAEQALSDLEKAIELDPNLDLAYANRAGLYRDRGDVEQAIADYEKAISVSTDPSFQARMRRHAEELKGQ